MNSTSENWSAVASASGLSKSSRTGLIFPVLLNNFWTSSVRLRPIWPYASRMSGVGLESVTLSVKTSVPKKSVEFSSV